MANRSYRYPCLLSTMINLRDSIFPLNVSDALCCDMDVAEELLISFQTKQSILLLIVPPIGLHMNISVNILRISLCGQKQVN